MSGRKSLAQRRVELVMRSHQQRAMMTTQMKSLRESMTAASVGASLLADIKQNKLLIAGVALALVVVKPRRIIAGLKTGLFAWQAWRNLVPVLQNTFRRK